jgi:virginiamycin B lyase
MKILTTLLATSILFDPSFPIRPASEINVVANIPVSGDWMCVGFGSLWEPSGGSFKRVDPITHQISASITVPGSHCFASPDESIVWIARPNQGLLNGIDPDTNTIVRSFSVGPFVGGESSFGVSAGGIWVSRGATLSRIDPLTGATIADIPIPNGSYGVVAEGNYIWVSSHPNNVVTQVDIQTNTVVKTIPVGAGPRFITSGEGGVWVLSQGPGTVSRIDSATGEVVAVIDSLTAGSLGGIAAGEGYVWVTMPGKPVTKIDPKNNTVVEQFRGSGFGDAINAGAGFVWVSGSHLSQIQP